eukprot:TRINITY_DN18242_c0_g1_i3.p2 TRINITY_DN18242_c0_g1~~TRINITY_DN18242_c0_g1_i3.p2  ORF type:complete len:230 (-),score=32.12 TRINITY_DN18242_c0_g1_i3:367-1056(-)
MALLALLQNRSAPTRQSPSTRDLRHVDIKQIQQLSSSLQEVRDLWECATPGSYVRCSREQLKDIARIAEVILTGDDQRHRQEKLLLRMDQVKLRMTANRDCLRAVCGFRHNYLKESLQAAHAAKVLRTALQCICFGDRELVLRALWRFRDAHRAERQFMASARLERHRRQGWQELQALWMMQSRSDWQEEKQNRAQRLTRRVIAKWARQQTMSAVWTFRENFRWRGSPR